MEYCKMKLKQLDSLQNHFYSSSYDKSSDLDGLECTKFVHVSSLMFLDFYEVLLDQRISETTNLWNLDVWIKSYELIGATRDLNQFEIQFKTYIETMEFHFTIRFYTSLAF
jgi:hypothetical protein